MTKEELIEYIRGFDEVFSEEPLEQYSYYKLLKIKQGIQEEEMKLEYLL